jgi:protein SCO1/2
VKNKQQSKMTFSTKIAAIAMLILFAAGLIYFISLSFIRKDSLPVLGEAGHRAGAFSFINQDGNRITEKTVQNKVTVAEYFFTSCPSICPIMNENLKKVFEEFKTDSGFMILSHTVDPERDSVSALKMYAKRFNAVTPGWQFLTGNKDSLYQMASRDYLLSAEDSSNSGFVHTQYVALLDKKRQIRGFYDVTNKENILKLDAGIRQLLKEDSN